MKRRARVLTVAFVMALGARAHAQASSAEDEFKRAVAAVERRDFVGAAAAFESALRITPHPVTAFDAALAWEEANEPVRAAEDFALALDLHLSEPQATEARKRLAALELRLARVALTGPTGARLARCSCHVRDGSGAALPQSVFVTPGESSFEIAMPDGRTVTRRATFAAGETKTLSFSDEFSLKTTIPVAPLPRSSASIRWLGWAGMGLGAALIGTGIGIGVAGLDARNAFVASDDLNGAARNQAVVFQVASNVLWISGAVIAAVGIAIVVWPHRRASATTTALRLLEGRF